MKKNTLIFQQIEQAVEDDDKVRHKLIEGQNLTAINLVIANMEYERVERIYRKEKVQEDRRKQMVLEDEDNDEGIF